MPLRSFLSTCPGRGDKTCRDAAGTWPSRARNPGLLSSHPRPTVSAEGEAPDPADSMRGAPRGGGLEGWPPADTSGTSRSPCRSWQFWPVLSWGVRTHGRCSVPQTLVSGSELDRQISESWWVSASPARKVVHLGTWEMSEHEQESCLSIPMSVCPGGVMDRPQPARAPPGRGEQGSQNKNPLGSPQPHAFWVDGCTREPCGPSIYES